MKNSIKSKISNRLVIKNIKLLPKYLKKNRKNRMDSYKKFNNG